MHQCRWCCRADHTLYCEQSNDHGAVGVGLRSFTSGLLIASEEVGVRDQDGCEQETPENEDQQEATMVHGELG